MEITPEERLMLVKKKEEIRTLTEAILETESSKETQIDLKKKVSGVLSLVSTIGSYSNSKNFDVAQLRDIADLIFSQLDIENYPLADCMLEEFSNTVNSATFDLTKKDVKIAIPKIDFSIFRKG